jgi:hypothetical protein
MAKKTLSLKELKELIRETVHEQLGLIQMPRPSRRGGGSGAVPGRAPRMGAMTVDELNKISLGQLLALLKKEDLPEEERKELHAKVKQILSLV